MTNTYALNVTRGTEFEVEKALTEMGVKPWVPKLLCSKSVKERKEPIWYDRPYVPKLVFCVFPPVYYQDVVGIKHVIGKPSPLSALDLRGTPEYTVRGTSKVVPARPGLTTFKELVDAEYKAMEGLRENAEWVCAYKPGAALEVLAGAFQGFPAVFKDAIRAAHHDHPMLRVEVQMMGRTVVTEVPPNHVSA